MKAYLYSLFFSLLIFQGFTLPASENKAPNFVSIAKKSTPSVVLVKTKQNQSSSPFNIDPEAPIPFEHPLWKFFFGPNMPQKQAPRQGQGSGFIVSADGYIVTNAHVIQNAQEIVVTINDGNEYKATLVGSDPDTDVAVIKIDTENLPFLSFADSDSLEVGEWVMAIGTPLGLQASITAGIVSAKGRSSLSLANYEDFIQTDASINPGNSGGPLINLDGDVIGINTAIASNTGGYMGIGFAIPSKIAQHILQQIITHGSVSRGYLGVLLQPLDSNLAHSFQIKNTHGALIAEVLPNSPADEAGLKSGDVIVKINGQEYKTMMSFRNAIALIYPGTQVSLEIIRDGTPQEIKLVIGENKSATSEMSELEEVLGFTVSEINDDAGKSIVVVDSVRQGSSAFYLGIEKGSIILSANNHEISSVDDFINEFEDSKAIKRILLLIKQGSHTRYVSVDY